MREILILAIVVIYIIGMWKVFTKAGKAGWAAIIPIYNLVVLLEIAGKPLWWMILLLFVPIANFIVWILVCLAIAEHFGKSPGFGIGLALLGIVFYPILGFGTDKYAGGPPAEPAGAPTPQAEAPAPDQPSTM